MVSCSEVGTAVVDLIFPLPARAAFVNELLNELFPYNQKVIGGRQAPVALEFVSVRDPTHPGC